MKGFLLRHRPSARHHDAVWGRNHRVRDWLARSGCLRFRREAVARGVAIGLLIGLTPTVGVQTILMLGFCVLMGGNFPVAFLFSWVSNPVTMAALYFAFHELGERIFGHWLAGIIGGTDWFDEALIDLLNMGLGSLVVAIPASVVGYLATLGAAEVWHRRRQAARDQRRRKAAKR
jgi:uncharacterized protein